MQVPGSPLRVHHRSGGAIRISSPDGVRIDISSPRKQRAHELQTSAKHADGSKAALGSHAQHAATEAAFGKLDDESGGGSNHDLPSSAALREAWPHAEHSGEEASQGFSFEEACSRASTTPSVTLVARPRA